MTQNIPPDKPDKSSNDVLPTSEEAADPTAQTIARRTDTLKRVISALKSDSADNTDRAGDKTDAVGDPDATITRPPTELLDILEQIKGELMTPAPTPEPLAKPKSELKMAAPAAQKPPTEPKPEALPASRPPTEPKPGALPASKPKTEPKPEAPTFEKPKSEPKTAVFVSSKPKSEPKGVASTSQEMPAIPAASVESTAAAPNRNILLQKLEELERLGSTSDETIVSLKASAKDLKPPTAPRPKSEPKKTDSLPSEKRSTGELRTPTGELKRATSEMKIVPAERPQPRVIDAESITKRPENALTGSPDEAPWTLQQFFNGDIDLDVELTKRFPTMPMMSLIKFRTLGASADRRVATLSTQDGAASLIVDGDVKSKVIQLSFTLGSMLTLRFAMTTLSDMDRTRWLELMRREQGGLAFLWGPERWAQDYMICISRKYHTNLYAFSPHNFDAAIRLTPAVTKQLLDWLDEFWSAVEKSDDEQPPLLTW